MKIKPIRNFCLIDPIDELAEQEKKSGLVIEHDNVMPYRGEVVSIGPEVKEVKVGDKVLFDRIRADNFTDKVGRVENKYILVCEDLIWATFK